MTLHSSVDFVFSRFVEMRFSGICACALSLLVSSALPNAYARPQPDTSKLLVVVDGKTINKDDYSQFWSSLEGEPVKGGYELSANGS